MAAVAVQAGLGDMNFAFFAPRNWQFQPLLDPLLGYSHSTVMLKTVASESGDSRLDTEATPDVTSEIDATHRYAEGCTLPPMDRLPSSSSSGSSSGKKISSQNCNRSSSTSSHTSSDDEITAENGIARDTIEIKRVFEKFDENNDGLICAKDLNKFMRRLGFDMSEEDAASMLKCVDHNNDGRVDFEEFYSLYKSLNDGEGVSEVEADEADDEDDTLNQAFQVFDKNGDGVITPVELQTVLVDLGLPEGKSLRNCKRMIERVDSDGNGEIDILEFKAMMCSNCFHM